MNRFWEVILGLDKGFLSRQGSFALHFNPGWPAAPLWDAGGWSWVLGAIAAALFFTSLRAGGRRRRAAWSEAVVRRALFAPAALAPRVARGLVVLARAGLALLVASLLSGATAWNCALSVAAGTVVYFAYAGEGRPVGVRAALAAVRGLLVALVLVLLNRPTLTLGQARTEPSVLAVLIDDSISMRVPDVAVTGGKPQPRLDAVVDRLTASDGALLRRLAEKNLVKIYRFSRAAQAIATVDQTGPAAAAGEPAGTPPSTRPAEGDGTGSLARAVAALRALRPDGDGTQVVPSVRAVLDDLQGQRLAGVVVLTDGRDTPAAAPPEAVAAVKSYGVNLYPVAVGSEQPPRNVALTSIDVEPSAFVDDFTNVKVAVRATGYEPGHPVTIVLEREVRGGPGGGGERTLVPLRNADGSEITRTVLLAPDQSTDVELPFKPTAQDMPDLHLVARALPQEGELDLADNARGAQVAVLDAKVAVLLVDGYPRWDYRYLKNSLLRDKSITLSCLLTSADPSFAQEGNRPIKAFPTSIEQLLDYDVVLFGDVDPRQFTDQQLQLVSDFVSRRGGGFEMVAGPRWSPSAFRNTPVEPLLPVDVTRVEPDDSNATITQGFRPVLTKAGQETSIFRFFQDRQQNDDYLKNDLQQLFWYSRGVKAKAGIGVVLAEHPADLGPDGRKAPILVAGHFGAGRTLYSSIDDSWRWRFYTGESIFDGYWVQQLRYLARGKKLTQRKLTFALDQNAYELGKQVTASVRVLSPQLLQQLSPTIGVELADDRSGETVRRIDLVRQEGQPDVYAASWTADRVGDFTVRLPKIVGDVDTMDVPFKVEVPRLELAQPQVDLPALSRLATDAPIALDDAAAKLPAMIHSAAKVIPVDTSRPVWDAPIALALFASLLTAEWLVRKANGMV